MEILTDNGIEKSGLGALEAHTRQQVHWQERDTGELVF